MRICLVYDCLFPYTVGGAERWYRNLGERLAADGHDVEYLTLRQWDRSDGAAVPGVRVRVVGPRMRLYGSLGRRRILPPLVFGLGVLWHLVRHGRRYDVVHTASFPYFPLLAAGLARLVFRYRLVVDWHEVWTREYWREYLGRWAGDCGWLIQRLCVTLPQRAFCFSNLHGRRLAAEGLKGQVTTLPGEYNGRLTPLPGYEVAESSTVVFAGRHIHEKRVGAIPPAIRLARGAVPGLRALILGDGPERARVIQAVSTLGLQGVIDVPGFVSAEQVDASLAQALCLLLPSRREGYGMVVIEAAMHGTPSIVVAGEDNAAVELVADGENGYVVASASASDLADAILRVHSKGQSLRRSTAAWFSRNSVELSLSTSLDIVIRAYGREPSARS